MAQLVVRVCRRGEARQRRVPQPRWHALGPYDGVEMSVLAVEALVGRVGVIVVLAVGLVVVDVAGGIVIPLVAGAIVLQQLAGHVVPRLCARSEERRLGNEFVSRCSSRWSPYP